MTHSHPQFSLIQRLLHIPAGHRSEEHIRQLLELTRDIKFFSTLSKAVHEACCRVMRIAEYAESDVVFNFGDSPDSFCVVLKGSVSVGIPTWTTLLANSLVKIPKSSVREIDRSKTISGGLSRFLSQPRSRSFARGLTIRPPSPSKAQISPELNDVATLSIGASFGELGLLRGEKRAATITCKECTTLAVLSKSDFDVILRDNQAKLLNDKINFLLSVPAFSMWSQAMMTKCSYYFNERNYIKSETVYREGEDADEVFVIVSGEFAFMKNVKEPKSDGKLAGIPRFSPVRNSESQVILLLKGAKEVFGDVEVIEDSRRETTCRCVSKTAHVLVASKTVRGRKDFHKRLQSIHTHTYLTTKAKSEHRWIKTRLDGLIEVEKLKREFTEPMTKREYLETQSAPKKPVGCEYDLLMKDLIRYSNTRHRRVVSDIAVEEQEANSPPRSRQATSRPGSELRAKDRIASALGTTRHPYLTRKRRDR